MRLGRIILGLFLVPISVFGLDISTTILNTRPAALKAYYKCNETSGTTITDYSGNGNNLSIAGTLGTNYWLGEPGISGSCFRTDGLSGYASIGVSVLGNLDTGGTTPTPLLFTIFAFFNGGTDFNNPTSCGVSNSAAPGSNKASIGANVGTTAASAIAMGNSTTQMPSAITGGTAFDGNWHSVALRRTGTGGKTFDLLVDGVKVATTTSTLANNSVLNRTSLMHSLAGAGQPFSKGSIQHAAMWTQDLTDAEILTIHQSATFVEGNATVKFGTKSNNLLGPFNMNWSGSTQNFTGATVTGLSLTGAVSSVTGTSPITVSPTTGAAVVSLGNIPVTNLDSGTAASSSTFWNGAGHWVTPPGAGNVSNVGTPTNGQLAMWTGATSIQGVTTLPNTNMPVLTGDVTTPGASLITTIAPNVVTQTKMFQLAPGQILGRQSTGTGNIELLTALPWPAGAGDVSRAAGTNSYIINTSAVTYAKMQNMTNPEALLGRNLSTAGSILEIPIPANQIFGRGSGDIGGLALGSGFSITSGTFNYSMPVNTTIPSPFLVNPWSKQLSNAPANAVMYGTTAANGAGMQGHTIWIQDSIQSATILDFDIGGNMVAGTVPEARIGWANPTANAISMWDNTTHAHVNALVGSGLTYTSATHTLSSTGGGGGGAPTTSTYITETTDATLTNSFALGSLATGLLKNTTTTGVPTIAVAGTDYEAALGNPGTSGFLLSSTTAGVRSWVAPGEPVLGNPSTSGYLLSSTSTGTRSWVAPGEPVLGNPGTSGFVLSSTTAGVRSWIATAPATSKYIVQAADPTLTNEQSLGALTTGLMKNTVTAGTGVISTAAAGTDYEAALGNPSTSGYVLSSSSTGTRSWIFNGPATGTGFWHSTSGVLDGATTLIPLTTGVTGVLPAANGGTGLTVFPAPGTAGNGLTSDGTNWTSVAPDGSKPDSASFASTWTPDFDTYSMEIQNALTGAITINPPTWTGTRNGTRRTIRFKDNGTSQTLTFITGSTGAFRASSDLAFPPHTTAGKVMYLRFYWNNDDLRWDLMAKLDNF